MRVGRPKIDLTINLNVKGINVVMDDVDADDAEVDEGDDAQR